MKKYTTFVATILGVTKYEDFKSHKTGEIQIKSEYGYY